MCTPFSLGLCLKLGLKASAYIYGRSPSPLSLVFFLDGVVWVCASSLFLGEQSCSHSTWPVTLCIYNLPPWLCMKRKFIMMPVLIQGLKQPGNDIDVYVRPLVDEL
jgi:hypothetical protein